MTILLAMGLFSLGASFGFVVAGVLGISGLES